MEGGYSMFNSFEDPIKFLGFKTNGKPINFTQKLDEKCGDNAFRLFKRIVKDSSNDHLSTSTIEHEQVSTGYGNRKPTRMNQNIHSKSNRLDTSYVKTHSQFSPSTSVIAPSKRNHKNQQSVSSPSLSSHHIRHHHDKLPLRLHHINNNNNYNNNNNNNNNYNNNYNNNNNNSNNNNNIIIDSYDKMSDSSKHLGGNEDSNTIYNHKTVNISDNKGKVVVTQKRLPKKPSSNNAEIYGQNSYGNTDTQQHGSHSLRQDHHYLRYQNASRKDDTQNNNDANIGTQNQAVDEQDDKQKQLKDRKSANNRNNAQATDKSNRKNKKNSEQTRHTRKHTTTHT